MRVRVDQLVHHREALEGVLAVEDARFVHVLGLSPARVERSVTERAVDRRTPDQDGEPQPACVQLLHARRHLL